MDTNNINLASAFETIAIKLEGSHLTDGAFEEVADATSYVWTKLKVNPVQAFILATMLHHAGRTMETKHFADFAKVSPIRMMGLQKDFDYLVKKGLIICVKPTAYNYWQQTFTLSAGMIKSTKYNKPFSPESYKSLTAQEVLDMIERLLQDCDYNNMPYLQMVGYLNKLIDDTQHIEFCKKIKELGMGEADLVVFLIGVVCLVSKNEDLVVSSDYDDILPSLYQRQMRGQFKDKRNFLCVNGLMEATDDNCETYRLTKKAKREFLKHLGIKEEEDNENTGIDEESSPTNQDNQKKTEKKLFYNTAETQQIDRLKTLLSQEKFKEVQNRMRAAGMRPGFACLFYGDPGTGKTETALQLARNTGREIVQVNVATLRNMYVGETEKNIQRVFDEYKETMEDSDATPILLFNEADGIFGTRYTGVNDSTDQMQNTIQNIILQNMETFEGILIATTNLTDNFDKAFERRFLFKIFFEKPKADVRKLIWMSVLPSLTSHDATLLASQYAFTGSMIENVARRLTIDEVLYERQSTLIDIKRLCEEELIKKPIGIKNQKFQNSKTPQ